MYEGCLLCPLYPLLRVVITRMQLYVPRITFNSEGNLLTQPFLILKGVGFYILLLSVAIRYCHSFKSYKVQIWKAVYISRRCQIEEKDNNCVNFWCRKSLGKLNHVPTSNKTDSFSILDLFYVKIKFLNERNCSKKRYLIKLWYKIGRCRL